jgi:hypothetical protein
VNSTHGRDARRDARATIAPHRFMVSMHGIKAEGAFHEASRSVSRLQPVRAV